MLTNHLVVVVGASKATEIGGEDWGITVLIDTPGDVPTRGHSTLNITRNWKPSFQKSNRSYHNFHVVTTTFHMNK